MEVTIVVTVLNEERTIDALLQSLINQTKLSKEIIIVDGGSTDATVSKLKKWASQNSPVKKPRGLSILYMQKVGNRSVGRNAGIERATHPWIAITDAGCTPRPHWLEELCKARVRSKAQVIAGYYTAEPESSFEEAVVPYALVMPSRVQKNSFLPATRSMLIAKKTWQTVGKFNELLSDNEDYAFALELRRQKVLMSFAVRAIVVWQPRSDIRSFANMIFRFARGDVRARILRHKVVFIFARYLLGLCIITAFWMNWGGLVALQLASGSLLFYAAWAIQKNHAYVPRGWYWLPILQVVSDCMVMLGSLAGLKQR